MARRSDRESRGVELRPWEYTRFRLDLELTRWTFYEVCEDDGEGGGPPVCNDESVEAPLGTQTALGAREMTSVNCESTLALVSSDTGVLPGSTQIQVDVPTNEWVRLHATTSTDANCEGAMACALHARTSSPIAVSVTSPNGELVAWQGVAGLVRVPEPGASLSIVTAFAVLLGIARSSGRSPKN